MRGAEESTLVLAGNMVANANPSLFPYAPVVDGEFLQDYPVDGFREGSFRKVPVITG